MLDETSFVATLPVTAAAPARPAGMAAVWTRQRLVILVAAYFIGLGGMIAVKGLYISADRYFLILLVPAVALGITRAYIRDFLPFIGLMLAYDFTRGYAYVLNTSVLHRGPFYMPQISVDQFLFLGHVPTVTLQHYLWRGQIHLFDNMIASFDHLHFFVPPTLMFLIWLNRRELFYRCAFTLITVSMIGALIFFLFPAAPPWLAGQQHLIHAISINSIQASKSPIPQPASLIESYVPRNPVAAIPSLHAAYSLLVFLFAWAWNRRIGYVLIAYTATMWFAIVYLGDHYVADIIPGAALALGIWLLSGRLFAPDGALRRFAGPFPAPINTAKRLGGSRS
jgi:hypothetical protein